MCPIEDSSLLAFYRDMNLPERTLLGRGAAGWALDGMDFMIYPLVIGTIITMWKVDAGTAGLAGTVTLLASAVGVGLAAYLADRIGRVKTLQLTILWFWLLAGLCLCATFDQLSIAARCSASALAANGPPARCRRVGSTGRQACGWSASSGWAVGWGLAVLSQAVLFSYSPWDMARRWTFAIGALPALVHAAT